MMQQDSKSEENCNLRSAKAGHSSNICLSSPNAPVLQLVETIKLASCYVESSIDRF